MSIANIPLNKDGLPRAHQNARNIDNPVVFFDISLGGSPPERLVMELFADVCPITCKLFLQQCTGEFKRNNVSIGYKGNSFHRLIPQFMIQGGDLGNNGPSTFDDENFILKHDSPGILSLANAGPNTNSSQFFITFEKAEHLDDKHVVFGKVIQGQLLLRTIEQIPRTPQDKPKINVTIVECGEM